LTLKREFIDYLNDIFNAVEKVEQFTQGIDIADFIEDEKTVFAVVRALEITLSRPSAASCPSSKKPRGRRGCGRMRMSLLKGCCRACFWRCSGTR